MNDAKIIDIGVKAISDFGNGDFMPHFIYCGWHYLRAKETRRRLQAIFLTKMKSYGIQFAILTQLGMLRWKLVTKETVKKAYQGKLKHHKQWEKYKGSINDDLDTFFTKFQDPKEVTDERVYSFFTPKLTEQELKLVEERNEEHLSTYSYHFAGRDPDVDVEEMKQSDSRSKYVYGQCRRWTKLLTLQSVPKQPTDKNISKTKKKCILS